MRRTKRETDQWSSRRRAGGETDEVLALHPFSQAPATLNFGGLDGSDGTAYACEALLSPFPGSSPSSARERAGREGEEEDDSERKRGTNAQGGRVPECTVGKETERRRDEGTREKEREREEARQKKKEEKGGPFILRVYVHLSYITASLLPLSSFALTVAGGLLTEEKRRDITPIS